MKNSIGSLAALSAVVAPAFVEAAPQVADFANVPVSLSDGTPIDFDIDGDGTQDFFVYGNFGSGLRVAVYSPTLRSASEVAFGNNFAPADATLNGDTVVWTDDPAYYGFSFVTGGQTHAAWVHFDTNTAAPVVSGGAWEMTPGASIQVGAIPEPASVAALAGVGALLGAAARRRRRPTVVAE